MRKRGFSLIELLVVCTIIGILIAILMPALSAAKAEAMRSKCGSQLHNLASAFQNYAFDNDQNLPRQLHLTAPAVSAWNVIGYQATTYCDTLGTENRCNTRALYTCLVRGGYADPERFICPAASGSVAVRPADRNSRWDFTDHKAISYSFQNNWEAGIRLSNAEGCPMMADRNPQFDFTWDSTAKTDTAALRASNWPDEASQAYAYANTIKPPTSSDSDSTRVLKRKSCNSLNHSGRGQNILCVGGNVKWSSTPLAGRPILCSDNVGRIDNIYTRFNSAETADSLGRVWGQNPGEGNATWTAGTGADLDCWLVP